MDRRRIAGLLGLILSGCVQSRAELPEQGRPHAPVELGGIPPIAEAINRGVADPSARRASTRPEPVAVAPSASPIPEPEVESPRPVAPPRPGTTDENPGNQRPAPFADRAPKGPRPRSGSAPALAPTADPDVSKTSASAPARPAETGPRLLAGSSGAAATVGSEVITLTQLRAVLNDQVERASPEQKGDPQFMLGMARQALDGLVERALVVQAAKKHMKQPKAIQQFYDLVDKAWVEHELPPMLREAKVGNIHELRQKLADRNKSLDQIREDFRQNALAREFMMIKVVPKMSASLNEKQKYYNAHVQEFNRPAQYVWREIAIDTAKCKDRAEARAKIDAIAARLGKGEDFERLARAESHGATAREGGRWEIAPGSYAIPGVNETLLTLSPGQTSGVIEAPAGFHVVRLESHREAGPARFDEVQDQVKEIVLSQKQKTLAAAFIDGLRAKTLVTTVLDTPPTGDPSAVRAGGESQPPAR